MDAATRAGRRLVPTITFPAGELSESDDASGLLVRSTFNVPDTTGRGRTDRPTGEGGPTLIQQSCCELGVISGRILT